jgi:peptidoglycan/xylan/chitin deacetylase (PgdA/CDA1 family)
MKIKVFLFHRVSPVRDLLWNAMTPKLFEQIIIHLNKEYEVVPLEKMLLGAYQPHTKKNLCAITFDDGYKDFINYAFPILQKHKAPSSMYVVTDCVDNDLPPWTFIINYLFINTSHLTLDIASKALPPALRNTTWRDLKERIKYAKKISPFLKQLINVERRLIYEQIINEFNDVDMPANMMMGWNDIREINRYGCEIGSHSVSHPLLAKKTNAVEINRELSESAKKIETEVGKFPITISYPFGSYNDIIKKLAQDLGYKIGLTVNTHPYESNKQNLFEVPRIELYDEYFFKSKLRINGNLQRIKNILNFKRILILIGLLHNDFIFDPQFYSF